MKGIDKTITYNYEIAGIDFKKLLMNENVKLNNIGKNTRRILDIRSGEYVDVVSIGLVDEMFGNLSIGVTTQNIGRSEYCNLEISLKSYDGDNIRPMKVGKFEEMQEKIVRYIKERYGIELIKDNSRFKELELNTTITLDKESKQYHYMFSLMELLLPKNYGNADTSNLKSEEEIEAFKKKNKSKGRYRYIGADNTVETIYFYNGDIEGKIYLKSEQIGRKYGIDIDENLLRVEYTLKNERKIKTIFGDNFIEDINDDKIVQFLDKQIEKDLIKPMEKHIKSAEKELKALAERVKAQGEKSWTIRFVNFAGQLNYDKTVPVLLDVENQVKDYLKKDLKKNYGRTIKRLEEDFKRIAENSYSSGSMELFKEFKEKCLN